MVAILHPYLLSFNLYRDVLIARSEKIIIDHETARAFPSLSHLVTGCASHCASLKFMSKTLSAVGLVTFSCEHNERVSVVRMRVSGALKSLGVLRYRLSLYCTVTLSDVYHLHIKKLVRNSHRLPETFVDFLIPSTKQNVSAFLFRIHILLRYTERRLVYGLWRNFCFYLLVTVHLSELTSFAIAYLILLRFKKSIVL